MNLREIRDLIRERLRQGSQVAAFESGVDDAINRAYAKLAVQAIWPWSTKRATLSLYADEVDVATATFTHGSRVVNLSTPVTEAQWLGHLLEGPDGEMYEIYEVSAANSLRIGTAYAGVTVTDTFSIRYRYYQLPVRFEDLVRSRHRTGQAQLTLQRINEIGFDLYRDNTMTSSEPSVLVLEEPAGLERADTPPTVASSAAASTLTIGVAYRYFYRMYYAGREGPRSAVVEFTPTTGAASAVLTLPSTGTGSGVYKRVYRSKGKSRKFELVATVADTVTTTTDSGTTPGARFDSSDRRETVRPYPLPGSDVDLEYLYLERPEPLVDDTDEPRFQSTFHEIIAFRVILEMLPETERGRAITFRSEHDRMLGQMMTRYNVSSAESNAMPLYSGRRTAENWNPRDVITSGAPRITY